MWEANVASALELDKIFFFYFMVSAAIVLFGSLSTLLGGGGVSDSLHLLSSNESTRLHRSNHRSTSQK